MKKCLSLMIREMQTKVTMKYLIPVTMATIKKTEKKYQSGCGGTGTLLFAGGNITWYSH